MSPIRLESMLCLGDVEISNGNRFLQYVAQFADSRFTVTSCFGSSQTTTLGYEDSYEDVYGPDSTTVATSKGCCFCAALDSTQDELYLGPAEDEAPWYEPNVAASEEFLGVFLGDFRMTTPISRSTSSRYSPGSSFGAEKLTHRILQARDSLMIATTPRGMAYGERWLTEALRGSFCSGGCVTDYAQILEACPNVTDPADADPFIRRLVGAALIDGPTFTPIGTLPECVIQHVSFQVGTEMPYLFAPDQLVNSGTVTPGFPVAGIATTDSWPGDAVPIITINPGISGATGIKVTGRVSLDGNCPPEHGGNPCFQYFITQLAIEEQFVIDGMERQIYIVNPATKSREPGLVRLRRDMMSPPLFDYPQLPPCSTVCIEVSVETGSADVFIEKVDRSL